MLLATDLIPRPEGIEILPTVYRDFIYTPSLRSDLDRYRPRLTDRYARGQHPASRIPARMYHCLPGARSTWIVVTRCAILLVQTARNQLPFPSPGALPARYRIPSSKEVCRQE
jgi:hypothetical protein